MPDAPEEIWAYEFGGLKHWSASPMPEEFGATRYLRAGLVPEPQPIETAPMPLVISRDVLKVLKALEEAIDYEEIGHKMVIEDWSGKLGLKLRAAIAECEAAGEEAGASSQHSLKDCLENIAQNLAIFMTDARITEDWHSPYPDVLWDNSRAWLVKVWGEEQTAKAVGRSKEDADKRDPASFSVDT